jgi:hypothetical protein
MSELKNGYWTPAMAIAMYEQTGTITFPSIESVITMSAEDAFSVCQAMVYLGSRGLHSDSQAARALSLRIIIDAHYIKARRALNAGAYKIKKQVYGKNYSKGYQLEIDQYTNNWLYAMRKHQAFGEGCHAYNDFCFCYGYGPLKHKNLKDGMTYYA